MDLKERNKKDKSQVWKNTKFVVSFNHALDGIKTIFKEERNMRNHTMIGIIPVLLGWYFKISALEWIAVVTCIFLVMLMEFINTIFETVVDMVTDYEFHPLAKKAKDIAAGAVLIAAIFTIIVAAVIFMPKFIALYF